MIIQRHKAFSTGSKGDPRPRQLKRREKSGLMDVARRAGVMSVVTAPISRAIFKGYKIKSGIATIDRETKHLFNMAQLGDEKAIRFAIGVENNGGPGKVREALVDRLRKSPNVKKSGRKGLAVGVGLASATSGTVSLLNNIAVSKHNKESDNRARLLDEWKLRNNKK